MRLIGISGKARSGKDELARILVYTYNFKQVSFARKVKDLAILYYDLTEEDLEIKKPDTRKILQGLGYMLRCEITTIKDILDDDLPALGLTDYPLWVENLVVKYFEVEPLYLKPLRRRYPKICLEGTQRMYEDLLNEFLKISNGIDDNIWVNYLFKDLDDKQVYVISDVRFLNEKAHIRNHKGKSIRIIRQNNPEIIGKNHVSETELDFDTTPWDAEIVNFFEKDWKERLVLSAANLIRKFKSEGFFTTEDLNSFNIRI